MVGRQVMTPTVNTLMARPCAARLRLGGGHALRGFLDRDARGLHEEGIAVPHREGAADRRSAGVHDDRPRAAIGLGLGAHVLQLDELPVEIEVVAVRPHQLDGVDPLLRVFVARGVVALLDAEHLELALVPADHDVESEAALADVIGGDHLLRRDDRMKQRRVHRAEHGDAPGRLQQAGRPRSRFRASPPDSRCRRRSPSSGRSAAGNRCRPRRPSSPGGDCRPRCRTSAPAPWSPPGPRSSWRRTARSSAHCRRRAGSAAAMTNLHSARLSLRLAASRPVQLPDGSVLGDANKEQINREETSWRC